jgi:hypothetical protein
MALDSVEQELFDFAWQSMPQWYRDLDRTKEELYGFAKLFGAVKKTMAYWFDMCLIAKATGRELGDAGWLDSTSQTTYGPDWLDFHAEDKGTRRAHGETDPIMRMRLRSIPQALTRTALLDAAQSIVDASGVVGDVDMVEFPRDAAYTGTYGTDSGNYGTFYKSGSTMTFVTNNPYKFVPYFSDISGRFKSSTITISGAHTSGNNGSFVITGLQAKNDSDGNPSLTGATYTNANGAAEADGMCAWAVHRINADGVVMDGWSRAYTCATGTTTRRGYRTWRGQRVSGEQKAMGGILLILPYGTTEAVRLSVREMLRQNKAAGVAAIVERRMVP